MPFWKTPAMCRLLGVRYSDIWHLLRDGRLVPPAKDSSGDYVWTEADVQRAREALAARRRTRQEPEVSGV
jgi:hypothetical protein